MVFPGVENIGLEVVVVVFLGFDVAVVLVIDSEVDVVVDVVSVSVPASGEVSIGDLPRNIIIYNII